MEEPGFKPMSVWLHGLFGVLHCLLTEGKMFIIFLGFHGNGKLFLLSLDRECIIKCANYLCQNQWILSEYSTNGLLLCARFGICIALCHAMLWDRTNVLP